jgi:hypothetical protein
VRDSTRRQCFHYPLKATAHGPGLTNGKNSTIRSFFTLVHCLFITCRTCGSTSATYRTTTCAGRRSTILKIAAAPSMRSRLTRCATRRSLPGTDNIAGDYGERWSRTGGSSRKRPPRAFFRLQPPPIPYGPDDGTLAPWAVAASLPFAPEIVLPSLQRLNEDYPEMISKYGFKCSYNPTFTADGQKG